METVRLGLIGPMKRTKIQILTLMLCLLCFLCSCHADSDAQEGETSESETVAVVTDETGQPICQHNPVTVPGTPPSCAADGRTDEAQCSECGEILIPAQAIPAFAHDYLGALCTVCQGKKQMNSYHWAFNGKELATVADDGYTKNTLKRLAGSVTSAGIQHGTRYALGQKITLYHNSSWVIEWRSSGTWTDAADGALLFCGATASNTADTPYLYRRHKSDFIAIGVYTGGQYHNYGISLSAHGIDGTADHVYQLVNRVSYDGTNMVYLRVDGEDVGPLNHHYIGGSDQNETSNRLEGQDLVFTYMGTTQHTIGGCKIDYIKITE